MTWFETLAPFASTFDALLLAALLLAAHRAGSTRVLRTLPWVAVGWFGFVRGGCPCPIGGVGEAAMGAGMAAGAAVMFLLPLAFAQLHGRTFCTGACPLGAFQDVFGFWARRRKSEIPAGMEKRAGLLRWFSFAAVSLTAAFAGRNLVCEVDPLPTLFGFRFETGALAVAAGLALASIVASRPFCRWLCPYAQLLESCARLAPVRLITGKRACVRCGKCDKVCPMNAIHRGEIEAGACIRCGRCKASCPRDAVHLQKEADDDGAPDPR